jgi:NADPH:quinone reductase-like Zn-dependent oxidoreductase
MKALMLTSYGKDLRQNIQIMDIDKPIPGDADVLVKVAAAGLNPVDYKLVYGNVKMIWSPKRPFPIGFDCSGTIEAVGNSVQNLKIGDEVYCRVPLEQIGTIAQYIVAPANVVAIKPKTLSFTEAAGIPLVAGTVLQSFAHCNIRPGQKVLIHAGSGGVGSFAIQYAKYLGAEVYTTTSTSNVQWVKDLGAKHVIDYRTQNYLEILPKMDVVFDTLGAEYVNEAIQIIKDGGHIVSIAGQKDRSTLKDLGVPGIIRLLLTLPAGILKLKLRSKKVKYKYVLMSPNKEQLDEISQLIQSGDIKAIVDRKFSLNDAVEAMCYLETGRAKGKVVVVI